MSSKTKDMQTLTLTAHQERILSPLSPSNDEIVHSPASSLLASNEASGSYIIGADVTIDTGYWAGGRRSVRQER
jgi:hypothetical protein